MHINPAFQNLTFFFATISFLDGGFFPTQVRGELTLGENIADTGGLGLSFDAYQKWVKRRISAGGSAESELPGVPLSIDQAFFVSYGQV